MAAAVNWNFNNCIFHIACSTSYILYYMHVAYYVFQIWSWPPSSSTLKLAVTMEDRYFKHFDKCSKEEDLSSAGKKRIESIIKASIDRGDELPTDLKSAIDNDDNFKILCHRFCVSTYWHVQSLKLNNIRNGQALNHLHLREPDEVPVCHNYSPFRLIVSFVAKSALKPSIQNILVAGILSAAVAL